MERRRLCRLMRRSVGEIDLKRGFAIRAHKCNGCRLSFFSLFLEIELISDRTFWALDLRCFWIHISRVHVMLMFCYIIYCICFALQFVSVTEWNCFTCKGKNDGIVRRWNT